MLRQLVADLESALSSAKASDLVPRSRRESAFSAEDASAFSEWLPYRAYLEDRQVFVNRDSLGFCLEVRPQSGADEEMTRVLTRSMPPCLRRHPVYPSQVRRSAGRRATRAAAAR